MIILFVYLEKSACTATAAVFFIFWRVLLMPAFTKNEAKSPWFDFINLEFCGSLKFRIAIE